MRPSLPGPPLPTTKVGPGRIGARVVFAVDHEGAVGVREQVRLAREIDRDAQAQVLRREELAAALGEGAERLPAPEDARGLRSHLEGSDLPADAPHPQRAGAPEEGDRPLRPETRSPSPRP